MSYSKLHSLFRLAGQLPTVKGRFALKQFQIFSPWTKFPLSSISFTFLFMPPSSLSAPQQHLLCCWRKHRTSSIWKKMQNKKRQPAAFLFCSLPLLSSPLHHPPDSVQFHSFLWRSVCAAAQRRCVQSICSRFAFPGGSAGAGTCHHQTAQHVWWGRQWGGTRGNIQALCSGPDSCCNHTSRHSLVQVTWCIPWQQCFLPLLAHLHSAGVGWGAINPLCVQSKHETAGFSEPPAKSCTADVQKMARGVKILEVHTGH